MADEDTVPKQAPLILESEILEEPSTTPTSDQPDLIGRTDQSFPIPSATETNSPETEIHRVDVTSSDDTALPNGASGSTADASHAGGGVQENLQHPTEDDPSNPLISPRYGTNVPIKAINYETYEPPPPPRPSWIQCMCCCFLTAYYIYYARKIRNFKYMPHVLLALLLIPFSAIYFGASYTGFCPLAPSSPLWLILAGLMGAVLLVVRASVLTKRVSRMRPLEKTPDTVTLALTIVVMILMTIEMIYFYKMYPNFDNPKDPVYCQKTFYYYLNYMNFVVMVLGILALLLHIPMKPSDPVQVIPLKYFEAI